MLVFATIYFENTKHLAIIPVKFWLYDCIYARVSINERVVFSFTNETSWMIYSSTKHYSIYNYSIIISQNKMKYMLHSTFKLHSSKNVGQYNQRY